MNALPALLSLLWLAAAPGKAPSAEESFRVEVLNRLEQLSRRLDGKI